MFHKLQYAKCCVIKRSTVVGLQAVRKLGRFMLHCWRDTENCGYRQGLECCLLSCHLRSFIGALHRVTRLVERRPETSPSTYILAHVLEPLQILLLRMSARKRFPVKFQCFNMWFRFSDLAMPGFGDSKYRRLANSYRRRSCSPKAEITHWLMYFLHFVESDTSINSS